MRALLMIVIMALTAIPAAANAWWNKDWPFRQQITIDASPKGGNIAQPAGRVPLLIRLHHGNFKFADATDKGVDLRFVAGDDKTPLAFHIESFDPLVEVAAVWVDVPAFPAGASKPIWLYYGNKKAAPIDDPAGTYDPDYSLVYHFDGAAGSPPTDATANHNTAQTPIADLDQASIIGKGAKFAGGGAILVAPSPSLAVSAGGPFTFSAWVKTAAPQPRAAIYVRREGGGALIVGLDQGVPFVELHNGAVQKAAATAPIVGNQWTHIAVTADGKVVTLYVKGHAAANLAGALPAMNGPTAFGGDVAAGGDVTGLVGEMDEVHVSKVARPPALIEVDASTQGAETRMLAFAPDQKQAGIGFGTLGLIIKSVDAPAWFIISLLAILAVGSWYVMYNKVTYARRANNVNDAFLEFFHEHGGEPVALDAQLEPGRFDDSPIYRVYHAGAQEMMRRAKRGTGTVTVEGVEVIRSLMNTSLVRENQRLSNALVVLTIAISGGPFLGLLGTVVGVMITFADIAAAGDVNINAIAPGISAALLATIAGLAVAIPALFGYNYILLRNKDISANMLVFVDEFITRVSERYSEMKHPLTVG
jgi:biopolymer transport protein ExbB